MDGICYLVCAGKSAPLSFAPAAGDLVVAVDGGLTYLEEAGIKPDIALGDFDSLGRVPGGPEVVRLDSVKDDTDTYAAASLGLERGYRRFRLCCALGGRLSHTIANIQTLAMLYRSGAEAYIEDSGTKIFVFGKSASFEPGGYLSLFPVGECARARISGCKYSGMFTFTSSDSLGVSNEPQSGALVEVLSGELVAVIEK
mgnify:FL=1